MKKFIKLMSICCTVIYIMSVLAHSQIVDPNFNGVTNPDNSKLIFNAGIYAVATQSDGKVLVGGIFTNINEVESNTNTVYNRIARLNADGSLDTTFNIGLGVSNAVTAVKLQSDGKVLIGGSFTSVNGTARNRIARLNVDGSLDTTFNIGSGLDGDVSISSLIVQPDGKVLIGGSFTSVNGTTRNRVARLNTDGSLDTAFNIGVGANNTVIAVGLQPDGKVLIGGSFTSVNGAARNRIARLNADGSLDTTFNTGSGLDSDVLSLAIQSDGKVLVGGSFASVNGTARNRIARLNADGSLDTTFDVGLGASSIIYALTLQPDSKVLIGGNFTSFNGTAINRIARLNTDGSLDTTFDIGSGASNIVYALTLQPDGNILAGGSFGAIGGAIRNRIARLLIASINITPSVVGNGGSISPSVVQNIQPGQTATFTLTPDAGYEIDAVTGSCGGSLIGQIFTTNPATADCTVIASFRLIPPVLFSLTPSVVGNGGSISPSVVQNIQSGQTATFTLTPDAGYEIDAVTGSCGGSLTGQIFTTNPITADCTVIASFRLIPPVLFSLTPSVVGNGGSISPSAVQNIQSGQTATFTLTPDAGYEIDAVTGSCGGTLTGQIFTTNPITTDCTVIASFRLVIINPNDIQSIPIFTIETMIGLLIFLAGFKGIKFSR